MPLVGLALTASISNILQSPMQMFMANAHQAVLVPASLLVEEQRSHVLLVLPQVAQLLVIVLQQKRLVSKARTSHLQTGIWDRSVKVFQIFWSSHISVADKILIVKPGQKAQDCSW